MEREQEHGAGHANSMQPVVTLLEETPRSGCTWLGCAYWLTAVAMPAPQGLTICQRCRHLGPRLQENRKYLDKRLPEIGFKVLPGQGTYFMIADIRPLLPPGSTDTDVDFCQKLTVDVGVTLIPVGAHDRDASQASINTRRRTFTFAFSRLIPSDARLHVRSCTE